MIEHGRPATTTAAPLVRASRSLLAADAAGIAVAVLVTATAIWMLAPAFASPYNLLSIAKAVAVLVTVALAQMTVLAIGQFNLSLTAIGAAAGLWAGWLMQEVGLIWPAAAVAGITLGVVTGAVQGIVIARSGINPFVVSLAFASIYFGLLLGISQGTPFGRLDPGFASIGSGSVLGFPIVSIFSVAVAILIDLVFSYTIAGRQMLAVGANPRAATLSGIRVRRLVVSAHALSGALAAIAAMILVSTLGSAQASLGATWLLPSFAAPVLGGTLLSGGRVSVAGTVLGAIFLVLLSNGLVLVGVSDYWYQSFLGVVLLAALVLDHGRRAVMEPA